MTYLQIDQVTKTYNRAGAGPLLALTETTIGVEKGQFVTIVGPSGCGKTTLLKIVQGLTNPTAGSVRLEGSAVAPRSGKVATVFQSAALFPWFTVLRNVSFGLECSGMPRREARSRAQQELDRVGLRGFENNYPHELSGGMQQRANLARAMAVNPDVLLLDEPYAALDPQTRDDMQAQLLDIWGETRKTVLMITHQIDEAVFLSDRAIVMGPRPGRLVADEHIALPRPRALEIKHTPQFQNYVNQIWHVLRAAEGRPALSTTADQASA